MILMELKRICTQIEKNGYYQGYCDLSLGAIYMENGEIDKGIFFIKRAYDNGFDY